VKKLVAILMLAASASAAHALEVGDAIWFNPDSFGCVSLEDARQAPSDKTNGCARFAANGSANHRVAKKNGEYICVTDWAWPQCLWIKNSYAQNGYAPPKAPSAAEIEWRKKCEGRIIECAREYEERRLEYDGRGS
jgi:hypothetical protein